MSGPVKKRFARCTISHQNHIIRILAQRVEVPEHAVHRDGVSVLVAVARLQLLLLPLRPLHRRCGARRKVWALFEEEESDDRDSHPHDELRGGVGSRSRVRRRCEGSLVRHRANELRQIGPAGKNCKVGSRLYPHYRGHLRRGCHNRRRDQAEEDRPHSGGLRAAAAKERCSVPVVGLWLWRRTTCDCSACRSASAQDVCAPGTRSLSRYRARRSETCSNGRKPSELRLRLLSERARTRECLTPVRRTERGAPIHREARDHVQKQRLAGPAYDLTEYDDPVTSVRREEREYDANHFDDAHHELRNDAPDQHGAEAPSVNHPEGDESACRMRRVRRWHGS